MPVTGFLGTRVGAIVAAAQARERAGARLALWDPVLDGDGYVRDALRSRLMADMRRDPEHRMTPDQLNGDRPVCERVPRLSGDVQNHPLQPTTPEQMNTLRFDRRYVAGWAASSASL